uniref:Uncharacterized protein n=1 Tax=Branchiostoma floridae TaxID=7739 RepID=C3YG34_BRAFL|eukprot:XP_002604829.1 hypothetical protein BRAFLDRAFT_70679 [Branchiostoma floridae]
MTEGGSHRKAINMSTKIFVSPGGELAGTSQLGGASRSEGPVQLTNPSNLSHAGATALLTIAITVPLLGFMYFMCRCRWRDLCRRSRGESRDVGEMTPGVSNVTVIPEIVVANPPPPCHQPCRHEKGHVIQKMEANASTILPDTSAIFPTYPARLLRTVSAPSILRVEGHVADMLSPPSWRLNSTGQGDSLAKDEVLLFAHPSMEALADAVAEKCRQLVQTGTELDTSSALLWGVSVPAGHQLSTTLGSLCPSWTPAQHYSGESLSQLDTLSTTLGSLWPRYIPSPPNHVLLFFSTSWLVLPSFSFQLDTSSALLWGVSVPAGHQLSTTLGSLCPRLKLSRIEITFSTHCTSKKVRDSLKRRASLKKSYIFILTGSKTYCAKMLQHRGSFTPFIG